MSPAFTAVPAPRRRWWLAGCAAAVVGLGLGIRWWGAESVGAAAWWVDHSGDALYAVLVYLIVALCAPGWLVLRVGGVALALCVAVELAQLTPVPAALGEAFAPARLVLGTTFGWVDLAAYTAGVAVAAGVDAAVALAVSARAARARQSVPRRPG